MANGTDSEIVELIIDAKNLTSDELNKAAEDVEGLGAAARKTEVELGKLKIKRDTIQSYEQVGTSVKDLRSELAAAEVAYENLAKATKSNKEATDEERASVKLANKDLSDLKNTLKDQEREYRQLSKSVKAYGVTSTTAKEKQIELNTSMTNAEAKYAGQKTKLDELVKSLKNKVQAEKQAVVATKEQDDELKELIATEEKELLVSRKRAAEQAKQAKETERVAAGLKIYERELTKLNKEKTAGLKSTSQYIRGEERLRKELKLTESQVKTSRRAIQADAVEKGEAAKNTDLLTTATRRLAQVYTVLLAAQKAVQAVGAGVREYSDLEAAITKVEKTTGLAREQVEGLADDLLKLSEDVTPTATNEMLRFAEVAGQLGTKSTGDILNLVTAADALERSTNLAGDEATELLARILTMTGEGIPAIHNLSSSVVALGNDFAVSEQDIVHMTKEIISGTREINLGSAAAAAFGTTLKELGQPAERSRTAIQRLAGAIKEASVEGGDDLERLTEITGLTAEQIEKDLGERPEKVIVAFLKGLNGISESGGIASDALRKMGIDGTEATSVLTVLAGKTDRLTQALKLSNEQYIAGDAHIKEAVKSYADQESALGRLGNKFTNLTAKIGEAFSDETDAAVRSLGTAITETEGDVVSLMEYLPALVTGLLEVGSAVEDLASSFTDSDGIGTLESIFELITFGANTLTIAVRQIGLSLKEVTLDASLLYNAFQPLDELKIDTTFLKELRQSMEVTKSKIAQDNLDIQASIKRLEGESSIAYEGLIRASTQYAGVIDTLGEKEQATIDAIIRKQGYIQGEDDLYRQLTASIVRANREIEIEAALKEQATIATDNKNESETKAADAQDKQAASQGRLNVTLNEYQEIVADVVDKQRLLNVLQDEGTITAESAVNQSQLLTDALKEYNVVSADSMLIMGERAISTAEYIERRNELNAQNEAGLLTDRELVIAQQDLSAEFSNSVAAMEGAANATVELSKAQVDVNNKMQKSEGIIRDLTTQIERGNLAINEETALKAKLAAEQEKLNELKAEQARLAEIEGATYPQLIVLQQQYQVELDKVNRLFRAGLITKAEYDEKTKSLTKSLSELNRVLGDNTEQLDNNTAAVSRRVAMLDEQASAEDKVTQYMSLELAVAQQLGKSYDFTSKSTASLNERYRELQSSIVKNTHVAQGWMGNLAKVSNEVFRQEQAVISETIAIRKWTDQVESGSLSMRDLAKMTADADRYFKVLSDNQMKPLLNAISTAQKEFQDLTDTINSTTDDIQDRLDRALGKESDIVKRQFDREIAEMQALIEQAESIGNASLVNQLKRALNDLKKAQKLEYADQFGGDTAKPSAPVKTTTTTTTTTTPTTRPRGEVTLNLNVGSGTFKASMDQNVLDQLMREIDNQQSVGG